MHSLGGITIELVIDYSHNHTYVLDPAILSLRERIEKLISGTKLRKIQHMNNAVKKSLFFVKEIFTDEVIYR